jgi:formylglycine-generating enzyme
MNDFTIKEIDGKELSQPMPFKYIAAKGKTFMFQADDGSNLGIKRGRIPITFEKDFWMCAYQTTQEFWERVIITSQHKSLNPQPSRFKGKTRPVEQVSWEDIQMFNKVLNVLFKENKITIENNSKPDGQFVLPSETQWEYAANAGQGLVFSGSQNLNDVAWYRENSNDQTMPVGLKQPNAWGLNDMSGNVWEWCADDFAQNIKEIPKNGQPNLRKDEFRVLRGGGFFDFAGSCHLRFRGNNRSGNHLNICGFRLGFSPSSVHDS